MTKTQQFLAFLLTSLLLTACQPKVYLMPPPLGLQEQGSKLFDYSKENLDDNLLLTLYATNRIPLNDIWTDATYTIFPSNDLRLGHVVHRIGEEELSWEEIKTISLNKDQTKRPLIKQEYSREMALYDIKDNLALKTDRALGFFDQVNQFLDLSIDKDILVYVHGANSNFYRATAQGAQFFHYTGHNTVVLTFSWPSAESLLRYKTDVAHAKQTVPAFSQLIELLALHTKAKHINIIAYSAGAQLVAPGLSNFVDQNPDTPQEELKKQLRIGEVYFAAPDTAFEPFIDRYLKFKDIVERTTFTINSHDSILRLAAFENGESRLGRPDITELTEAETEILIEASNTPQLNILDISGSKALAAGGAHNSWYAHPWVSNDLLLLLLFNANPKERGLTEYIHQDGARTYLFPDDYTQKIHQLVKDNQKDMKKYLAK